MDAATIHIISATSYTDGTHGFMCGHNAGRYDDAVKVHPVGNFIDSSSPAFARVTCEPCQQRVIETERRWYGSACCER